MDGDDVACNVMSVAMVSRLFALYPLEWLLTHDSELRQLFLRPGAGVWLDEGVAAAVNECALQSRSPLTMLAHTESLKSFCIYHTRWTVSDNSASQNCAE
eukprot:COSAG05_NODE_105_length_18793_cov_115.346421_21_plen_100_part_00